MRTHRVRRALATTTATALMMAGQAGLTAATTEAPRPTSALSPTSPVSSTPSGAAPVETSPAAIGTPSPDGVQTVRLTPRADWRVATPPKPATPWSEEGGSSVRAAKPVVLTDELAVRPFRLAGLTWQGEGELTAWVRVRTAGAWSSWYQLPPAHDHEPDPGTAEAANSRPGTDPLLVGQADAVQVRVDAAGGVVPADLRLDLVDPTSAEGTGETTGASATAGADTMVAEVGDVAGAARQPAIRTRAAWGADESLRADPPDYGVVNGAFVHHTVSATSYSEADVPAMIRSIYTYHVKSRGWNDIGYNFLVDRYGHVWEGRYGGVGKAVIGAHTQRYNDDAFAMSALGTYTDAAPSAAMLSAYGRLFAWKFGVHRVDPRYAVSYDGERWGAISGHRDAAATECPGTALYAKLPSIRARTAAAMGLATGQSLGRDIDGRGHGDLVARRRSDASLWLWPGNGMGSHGRAQWLGSQWSGMGALLLPGDWNRDGHDDLIGRRRTDGSLVLYRGNRWGQLGSGTALGRSWSAFDRVVASGDWNRDGRVDLVGHRSDGTLWLFAGDGKAGFVSSALQIGHGWSRDIAGVGDWNGDGIPDLMARLGDGTLWLYPGDGRGRFGTASRIGRGWGPMSSWTGIGDTNGDHHPDVAAWTSAGELLYYFGDGKGGFMAVRSIGPGWNLFDLRS